VNDAKYHTGEFARRASVSPRTLRFYDRIGLLTPSGYTESGYRIYGDEDLATLQQILALKYLGLSLEEIRQCLNRRSESLSRVLQRQKRQMTEKRQHLDRVIRALDAAEASLASESFEWSSLTRVIEAMQMEQDREWVKSYFTDKQLKMLSELVTRSYSGEAMQMFAGAVWTEEDQKRASAQWQYLHDECKRLAALGADPAGEEGQALAKLKTELLSAFTKGKTEVETGLKQFWSNHNALPTGEQPLADWAPDMTSPDADFIAKAVAVYQANGGA